MSGLRHGWGKFHNNGHADFVHGGVPFEDFEEVTPYKKPSKGGKGCKKSKTREPCNFTVVKVIGTYMSLDPKGNRVPRDQIIRTCERCGKYGWGSYQSVFRYY